MTRFCVTSFFLFFVALMICSCGKPSFTTEQEYYQWMNKKENGLMVEKFVNATHLKVNLIPEHLLLLKELNRTEIGQKVNVDSIKEQLANTKTFVMTIGPDKRDGAVKRDIVRTDVKSYEEYKNKLMRLNFELEDLVVLKVGEEELKPVLSSFENVYGLVDNRKVSLVFVPSDKEQAKRLNESDLELVFEDQIFDTGLNYFVFERTAIEKIPTVNLQKI